MTTSGSGPEGAAPRAPRVTARSLGLALGLALALGGCTTSTPSPTPLPPPSPPATSAPPLAPTTAAPTTAGPTSPPSTPPSSPPAGPAPTVPSAAVTTTPPPSPGSVPADWAGVDWEVLPTSRKVVALTFDGGASDTAVPAILETLRREAVPATFFVTGQFARTYPDSVRAMAGAGHPVGNHSDTHPAFSTSTNAVIRAELAAAEAEIAPLTGRTTKPLFRFPYGDRTALDVEVVNGEGYVPFRWTVDTLGWKGTAGKISAAVVCDRVLGTARAGQIVLMHVGANPDDGTTFDSDALPCIIAGLRDRGYGFVNLREFTG